MLLIGKVLKPHGIKGELKILPFSGNPDELLGVDEICLGGKLDSLTYKVEKARSQGKFLVLKLVGVGDRNTSDTLIGLEAWVSQEILPELAPDEFYWYEMEGLEVSTVDGRLLGRVTSLLDTGAHDVLVIKGAGGEYLVPAINEIIVNVDQQARTLVIDPPPGLLEINESDAI